MKQPRIGLLAVRCENSPYVSYSGNMKNCYLCSGSEFDEDCYYSFFIYHSKDCFGADYCHECTLCYDCVDCRGCYNINYSQDCVNCTDCEYLYDCVGCNNCFGCVGLRRQKFCIFNEKVNENEYFERVEKLKKGEGLELATRTPSVSGRGVAEVTEELKRKTPRLYVHQLRNENCTGDYVYHSKNSLVCYDTTKLEDCMYCNNSEDLKDCMDMSNTYFKSQICYEIMAAMELYNCNYCVACFYSRDLDYCENVHNSRNCFGCFSMNHAEFCIFNEKYSKEEYFKKRAEMIEKMKKDGEYGEHLFSTYKYEDSNAAMHWAEPW